MSLPLSAVALISGHTLSGFRLIACGYFYSWFTMFLKSDECRQGRLYCFCRPKECAELPPRMAGAVCVPLGRRAHFRRGGGSSAAASVFNRKTEASLPWKAKHRSCCRIAAAAVEVRVPPWGRPDCPRRPRRRFGSLLGGKNTRTATPCRLLPQAPAWNAGAWSRP